jgi:hypothetical protein
MPQAFLFLPASPLPKTLDFCLISCLIPASAPTGCQWHDELEREVAVIETGKTEVVREHHGAVGRWRVRLSDLEAWNFGQMELFILVLIGATLVRICTLGLLPGDILTIFQFLMMFLIGVDSVPQLVQQFSRLHDSGGRMNEGKTPDAPEPPDSTAKG